MSPQSAQPWFVTTFYFFKTIPNDQLLEVKDDLISKGTSLGMEGLFILAEEGLNSTCSAPSKEALEDFKSWLHQKFDVADLIFKDSKAPYPPFRKFKVKIRKEIVTLHRPGLVPAPEYVRGTDNHLTPEKWNEVLENEKDFVLIDTRNWYEYEVGTFKGAVNPNITEFTSFPEFVEELGVPKDKKMLIFCTGGIRCEKGILDLQEKGYEKVYQLQGGILKYIEEFPNRQFDGECFVFDHRVAVNQELEPSTRFELCPHCGQPGETVIQCGRCDTETKICKRCAELELVKEVCSKNCAHWWKLSPGKKGHRQIPVWERKQH